jgi:hypothetical protein
MRGANYIKRYNYGTPDNRHYRACVGLLALWLAVLFVARTLHAQTISGQIPSIGSAAQEPACIAAHTCLRPGAMEGWIPPNSNGVAVPQGQQWIGFVTCDGAVPDGDLPFFAGAKP